MISGQALDAQQAARCARNDVVSVARAENDGVEFVAVDKIIARATIEDICARAPRPTCHYPPASEDVIPAAAVQLVVTGSTVEDVVTFGVETRGVFAVEQPQSAVGLGNLLVLVIGGVVEVAPKLIVTIAANEFVIARLAVKPVVVGATIEEVVSRAAEEFVVTGTTVEVIVAGIGFCNIL